MRIAALATGVGNIRSVLRALDRAVTTKPTEITATADPDVVRRADVLVVPGQGAFGAFATSIKGDLRDILVERIRIGTPYFGICLGLQILFEESDEAPDARGLGVLRGRVIRLDPGIEEATERPWPLPHIGWNHVLSSDPIVAPDHYYFAHSYAVPSDSPHTIATTTYGTTTFASAIRKDNVFAIQFHPEKSQRAGLALIERFFSSFVEAQSK